MENRTKWKAACNLQDMYVRPLGYMFWSTSLFSILDNFMLFSKDTKRLPKNPFVRRVRLLMKYFFQFDPAFSNNNIWKRKVVLVHSWHGISFTKSLHSSEKLWSVWDIFIQLNHVGQCSSTALEVCSEGTSVNVAMVSGYCDLDFHGMTKAPLFLFNTQCLHLLGHPATAVVCTVVTFHLTHSACTCWDILQQLWCAQ